MIQQHVRVAARCYYGRVLEEHCREADTVNAHHKQRGGTWYHGCALLPVACAN
jgi:hypothetical protein